MEIKLLDLISGEKKNLTAKKNTQGGANLIGKKFYHMKIMVFLKGAKKIKKMIITREENLTNPFILERWKR